MTSCKQVRRCIILADHYPWFDRTQRPVIRAMSQEQEAALKAAAYVAPGPRYHFRSGFRLTLPAQSSFADKSALLILAHVMLLQPLVSSV